MERNADKIKRLEHELGRYQKKVGDQGLEVSALRGELRAEKDGVIELRAQVDALLITVAMKYGEVATDPDGGQALGWRLKLPQHNFLELISKYELQVRKDDEEGVYILGVAAREGMN